jgi:hypothetical protein
MGKKNEIRILKVRKNASLKEIYRRVREEFTAADLQKFTVIEPMIPGEQLLAELEAIYDKETRRNKKKKNKTCLRPRMGSASIGSNSPLPSHKLFVNSSARPFGKDVASNSDTPFG